MVSRIAFDVLAAFILTVTAALGAYAPMFLSMRDKSAGGTGRSLTLIIGNMFSAGVMVSAGFCHLLGEAVKQMPAMQFSLATFLCGLGYLLTLCADKAATILSGVGGAGDQGVEVLAGLDLAERVNTPGRGSRLGNNTSRKDSFYDPGEEIGLLRAETSSSSPTAVAAAAARRRDAAAMAAAGGSLSNRLERTASETTDLARGGLPLDQRRSHSATAAAADALESGNGNSNLGFYTDGRRASLELESGSLTGSGLLGGGTTNALGGVGLRSGGGGGGGGFHCYQEPPPLHFAPNHAHAHGHSHFPPSGVSVSFITAVLMAVALCFHSILEGAAMGAQPTLANSLHIFIAIVSHKGLAAYALGSSIVESNVGLQRFWSVVLPFTFASPVGIFIGYAISDAAQGTGAAAISALASGTFLYVAFMEVIPRELHDPNRAGYKLAALMLGFALMSLLAIWA